MPDWFRNAEWNDEIAIAFEDRLRRARHKAQYLNIQGYTLLGTHPMAAATLLRRAGALEDPGQTARAYLYLGTALAMTGDLDGAIESLGQAIEAERRYPMCRTGAKLDRALLIAIAERYDLYEAALDDIEQEAVMPFADQLLSALIAGTLIRGALGEDVQLMALAALEALSPEGKNESMLPAHLSIDSLRRRLGALARTSET